ncbi:MAG: hypothetical protein Q9195_001889 [Heterodermia aff. obscurata]
MAPHRALSFPLSCTEELARQSPFTVPNADAAQLGSCDAFRIIRKLLANQQGDGFCNNHALIDGPDRECWLLQRDITHALIFPVLELFRHASNVAQTMLGDRNIFDLELIFRGEARGAFAWLQCFIAEEEDWCRTRGCPVNKPASPATQLPVFDFWLSSLRNALHEDPFWGPDFGEHLERRAAALEHGLNELVSQCFELDSLASKGSMRVAKAHAYAPSKPTKLRTSKLAEKQIALAREESSWMQQIVLGCWTTLLADAAKVRRKASVSKPHVVNVRVRCLTT